MSSRCQTVHERFYAVADNGKVFMKKGEFGTRQPVAGAGFCSKVELLPNAS